MYPTIVLTLTTPEGFPSDLSMNETRHLALSLAELLASEIRRAHAVGVECPLPTDTVLDVQAALTRAQVDISTEAVTQ